MKRTYKIAIAQVTSTVDTEKNKQTALDLFEKAVQERAKLIAYPENFLFLGNDKAAREKAESIPGPTVTRFQKLAKENNISILLRSILEAVPNSPKVYNTSVLINEKGDILAKYRKIHLFDLKTAEVNLQESKNVEAGNEIVVVPHEIGKFGLSICYDLRFPIFFRKMRMLGAQIIFVPSAFTLHTGKDHWLPLLRARAIENQVYIVAPAQIGSHNEKRKSYGKSAIIDPWGSIVTCAPDRECVVFGEIDLDYVDIIQRDMPVLSHQVEGID